MQFAALNTSIERGSGGKNKKKEGSRRNYTMHTQLIAVRGSQRVGLQSQYFFSSFFFKVCWGERRGGLVTVHPRRSVQAKRVLGGLTLGFNPGCLALLRLNGARLAVRATPSQ